MDAALLSAPQGSSLSYERRLRLRKYAENRAKSCLGLLSDSSAILWKTHDYRNEVALFRPNSEWSELLSAKAIVKANVSFPTVLKTLYDAKTSAKFKLLLRQILGESVFLDAEVLEDLDAIGTNNPRLQSLAAGNEASTTGGVSVSLPSHSEETNMYKHASIKWWAIKSCPIATKSSDFYVLDYIGIEQFGKDINSVYWFQESLAEVGGMPHIHGNNLERYHFDALICKFERLLGHEFADEQVKISVVFQRPPPLVSLFRSNPAVEMVYLFAKGLQDLFENPFGENQEISVVKTSAWVHDKERQYCFICLRKFSSLFRRKHHCRTCGEIICWQCSTTIRVSSISFTHNDMGKQVLSRHQPSIRVCTKCAVANQRANNSAQGPSNQDEFKQWMTERSQGERHDVGQGTVEGPTIIIKSSHGSSASTETPPVPIPINQRYGIELASDRERGSSLLSEDEEEKQDVFTNQQQHVGYGRNRGQPPVAKTPPRSTSRSAKASAVNVSPLKSKRRAPSEALQESTAVKSLPVEERRERQLRQQVQLQEQRLQREKQQQQQPQQWRELDEEPSQPDEYPQQLPRKHLYQRDQLGRPPGRSTADSRSSRRRTSTNTTEKTARDPSVADSLLYSLTGGAAALDSELQPVVENQTSCVQAASAWCMHANEEHAIKQCFQDLMTKLGGQVHFLVVGFSTAFSADAIVDLLGEFAPGVPFIGGTIARGMCDERAWIAVNRHNDEGLVCLWGINDPFGVYTVVHTEYAQSDAKHKTYAATKTALAKVSVDIEPGENPAFVIAYACPLFVEYALDGIREAVTCPVVGGCSADAPQYREGDESASWMQISSSRSMDFPPNPQDLRGDATEMGIAFALCYPSVETHVGWFSGYSPVTMSTEYCMGTVTKASAKTIFEINGQPAAKVYYEWLESASNKSVKELDSVGFPRVGNLHPLGTLCDYDNASNQRDPAFDAEDPAQLTDLARFINTTAVITGINGDNSLSTTSSIIPGTTVVLMETSELSLKLAINKMGSQAVASRKFRIQELAGCLMFLSAGVQALLGHKSMAEMVGAYRQWSGGAPLLSLTTFGEIGHLLDCSDTPHYDSLMFGAVMFSKRMRKINHSSHSCK